MEEADTCVATAHENGAYYTSDLKGQDACGVRFTLHRQRLGEGRKKKQTKEDEQKYDVRPGDRCDETSWSRKETNKHYLFPKTLALNLAHCLAHGLFCFLPGCLADYREVCVGVRALTTSTQFSAPCWSVMYRPIRSKI